MSNPLGHSESWSNYNGLGLATHHQDVNGVISTYSFNETGTLRSATQFLPSGPRVTTIAYDHARRATDVAHTDGRVDRMRYNAAGRITQIGNASFDFVGLGMNVPANSTSTSSARQLPVAVGASLTSAGGGTFSSTQVKDSLGRPYTDIGNAGQQVQYGYDGNGNLRTRTDGAGRTTAYEYDAQDRITRMVAPDHGETTYSYNPAGRLSSVRDPRGLITSYSYNGFGDVVSRTSPDTGTTIYYYDIAGRMTYQVPASGTTVAYHWDALDRLILRGGGILTETFSYDEGAYGVGRRTGMNDQTGHTTYAYGGNGQPLQQVSTIYGITFTTSWRYDGAGRLAGMTYPGGVDLVYQYDAVGRLARVASNVSGASTMADSFLYQPATDQRFAWRFGNNVPRTLTHDTDGRVQRLFSSGVQDVSYGWSNVDTVSAITDSLFGAQSATFGYDANDRLTSVGRAGDNQVFGPDSVGNRLSHNRGGIGYNYQLEATANRPASISGGANRAYGYSATGNLISETGPGVARTFGYDGLDRMQQFFVSGNLTGNYARNGLDQRVYKWAADVGATWLYLHDAEGKLLYEWGSGPTTSYVWLGGELLGFVRNGAFYASHNDHLGRPEAVSDTSGQIVWRAVNAAFDRTVVTNAIGGLNVGLPGQYFDAESGLYYNWHRHYDPGQGRYMQADPLIQSPGDLQSYNRYSYCMNNPLTCTDPSGYSWLSDRWHALWNNKVVRTVIIAVAAYYTGGYALEAYASAAGTAATAGYAAGSAATVGLTATEIAAESYYASAWAYSAASASVTGGAIAGAAGGFTASFIGSNGNLRAGVNGAVNGAIFGGIAGNYGSTWNTERVAVTAGTTGLISLANGGQFSDGFRDGLRSSLLSLSVSLAGHVTDSLKRLSCESSPKESICAYNRWGELLTDGGRNVQCQNGPGTCWGENLLTRSGMGQEGAGLFDADWNKAGHYYSENGYLGRFINNVSKVHDLFNSVGYDWSTGAWISRGAIYDSLFQIYSFAGMIPAAAISGLANANNPLLMRTRP